MARRWTPGAFPAPRPAEWGLDLPKEGKLAQLLWARANRLRNEIEQAKSREQALEASIAFCYNTRDAILKADRPVTVPFMVGLDYLGSLTTPLLAAEANSVAKAVLALRRAGGA